MQSDLELEELQTNLFKAPEDKLYKGGVGIFGGQLLAHALGAASAAMPDGFDVNSLHCYFMRSARVAPTLYQVTPERVGRSYATCSVEGLQDGKAVIKCLLSFHRPEVSSSEHQLPMPMYPTPEELLSPEAAKRFAEAFSDMSPERRDLLKRYQDRAAIEVLFVIPHNDSGKAARPARQQTWMRSRTRLPDDSSVHCAALAYMSDYHSLFIATMPHPEMRARLKLITSLDHSLWFHGRPFRADECEI